MKGLNSVAELADAPNLEYVQCHQAGGLDLAAFEPLIQAPSMKAICVNLGSIKKNKAFESLVTDRGLSTDVPPLEMIRGDTS